MVASTQLADELRSSVADLTGMLKTRLAIDLKPGAISIVLPREAFFALLDALMPRVLDEIERSKIQNFAAACGMFLDPLSGVKISVEWTVP